MLADLIKYLTRKKVRVVFNDLSIVKPVSSVFGLDRGTPIDRYYIERFLARHAGQVKGRVLEIGDSSYSRQFGGEQVESFEVMHATPDNRAATIIGDLTDDATLPQDAIDCFICTQTFNFIFDVQQALRGAHHLLKPGGVLLATVAGISQISRYDMDRWGYYWSFTTRSAEELFGAVFPRDRVQVGTHGNVLAAIAFLHGLASRELRRSELDYLDPDYQLLITVRAMRALGPA
jgi:SAM-dependent methyltransferase